MKYEWKEKDESEESTWNYWAGWCTSLGTELRAIAEIGYGRPEGSESPDHYISFFALKTGASDTDYFRAASTSGDPVWEDEDQQVFAELAESVGVSL